MAQRHSLKQHGVNIKWYHPIGTGAANLMRRMHDKYLAADQNQLILGSRNIGDVYVGQSIKKKNFIDLDVQIVDPSLLKPRITLRRYGIVHKWISADLQTPRKTTTQLDSTLRSGLRHAIRQPRGPRMSTVRNYSSLMTIEESRIHGRGFTETFTIFFQRGKINPNRFTYFHPTPELVGILYSAQCRGVSVKVLTNSLERIAPSIISPWCLREMGD